MVEQSEHEHQVSLFQWLDVMAYRYPLLSKAFAIANGGLRNIVVAKKLQAEGVKPGIPDVFIPVPMEEYHGLWIELKRSKGRESEYQKEWRKYLNKAGYLSVVAYGWIDAVHHVVDYFGLPESVKPKK